MPDPVFDPQPVTLEGKHVRLVPLAQAHAVDLLDAARDELIWRYMLIPPPLSMSDMSAWIDKALADTATGESLPFAIIDRASGKAIGSTRYLEIRRGDKGLEIGWTWVSTTHQRTPVNTECKLLLLSHAFETLGAIRVQFKTDSRNTRSQQALERIGAVREGVLRQHRILWDGFLRDSVYYSILDSEWPAVKQRLESLLRR